VQKFYGKVTDTSGNPVANARLSVYQANVITPLPTIFKPNSDNTLGTLSNPFLTDSDGQYAFVVGDGEFEIRATGSSAVLNISKTITQFQEAITSATPIPVTLNRQLFTSSASWTAPTGVIQVTVTCVGGGGAGGGTAAAASNGGASGGTGGGTVRRVIPVTPGIIYSVVIGAGGVGATNADGTTGSNSTFGSALVIGPGGAGGLRSTTSTGASAPTGGFTSSIGFGGGRVLTLASDAALAIADGAGVAVGGGAGGAGGNGAATGANGSPGIGCETFAGGSAGTGAGTAGGGGGGGGGSSAFGNGANGPTWVAVGTDGISALVNSGGGGSGASNGSAAHKGGDGGSGLCIVEWIS